MTKIKNLDKALKNPKCLKILQELEYATAPDKMQEDIAKEQINNLTKGFFSFLESNDNRNTDEQDTIDNSQEASKE